jgi:hypothetical protein
MGQFFPRHFPKKNRSVFRKRRPKLERRRRRVDCRVIKTIGGKNCFSSLLLISIGSRMEPQYGTAALPMNLSSMVFIKMGGWWLFGKRRSRHTVHHDRTTACWIYV